jgi:hypothetical protein
MSGSNPVLTCLSCHSRIVGTPNEKRVEMLVTIFSVEDQVYYHSSIVRYLFSFSTSSSLVSHDQPGVRLWLFVYGRSLVTPLAG